MKLYRFCALTIVFISGAFNACQKREFNARNNSSFAPNVTQHELEVLFAKLAQSDGWLEQLTPKETKLVFGDIDPNKLSKGMQISLKRGVTKFANLEIKGSGLSLTAPETNSNGGTTSAHGAATQKLSPNERLRGTQFLVCKAADAEHVEKFDPNKCPTLFSDSEVSTNGGVAVKPGGISKNSFAPMCDALDNSEGKYLLQTLRQWETKASEAQVQSEPSKDDSRQRSLPSIPRCKIEDEMDEKGTR